MPRNEGDPPRWYGLHGASCGQRHTPRRRGDDADANARNDGEVESPKLPPPPGRGVMWVHSAFDACGPHSPSCFSAALTHGAVPVRERPSTLARLLGSRGE